MKYVLNLKTNNEYNFQLGWDKYLISQNALLVLICFGIKIQ